ncbi:MAG: hypothetical protein KGZ49_04840 [Syntrophaceae bacterium]|nr:hypothetical protein [Syntrophaceae bacterium]
MARRISRDWQEIYHHEVVWLETFVDPERGFSGTCYKVEIQTVLWATPTPLPTG